MTDKSRNDADTYADRLFHALSARQTLAPLTADDPGFDLAAGYAVAAALRARRGGRTVGRKIGFSNTAIWPLYGIDGPMWGWMYEGSVDVEPSEHSVPADAFVLPRIEPEILLHLTTAPSAAMESPSCWPAAIGSAPGSRSSNRLSPIGGSNWRTRPPPAPCMLASGSRRRRRWGTASTGSRG